LGRPDDRLGDEAIHISACGRMDCFASLAMTNEVEKETTMDQLVRESLTSAQRDDLRVISGMMIPESDAYKVPGADDAAVQGDIIATLGRDTKMMAAALDHIAKLAGQPLVQLDAAKREAVVTEFRASGGTPAAVLARVILQCYYRDDRVLRSLGIELRAPFPKGHVLPDGDWSILDPVKARGGSLRRV
jgi:hypothetical protein